MNRTHHFAAILAVASIFSVPCHAQTAAAPSAQSAPNSDLAQPTHPATEAQVREYLTLTSYVANAHKAMGQMIEGSRTTAPPYFPDSFWSDMAKSLEQIDLITPAVPAYQKYFSEEDMAATISFYKSSAGQKFLSAQPFIASAAGEVLRDAGQKVGQEVFARHKDEIEAIKKKFDAEQEPEPAGTKAPKSATPPKK